ncbi:hypothetical protein [Streptococcus macedonicus]|nr:hypothetical protein [Streptococcus macedonicus]
MAESFKHKSYKEQAKATADAITAEIKKQKDVPQKVEVTIKDDKK